ncbi:MAG: hypothetical protein J6A88_02895 [Oscillospiraceae bacterium]|nr:hypothetical protein [Oscillospiraceae bacterium]
MKKLIAILLSCMMLVSISPAVAAEDAPAEPKPTVEEILNDFHQKAFAAESANECETAAAYSRSSSSGNDSLVQETVDTLNAAGYEAYNVTSSNYDALETELKTDFASMGLDPNGSYIIVIEDEDDTNSNNPNSRVGNLPAYDLVDPGDSTNKFRYTYEGVEYRLRRIYLTAATESDLRISTKFEFSKIRNISDYVADILGTTLSLGIDAIANKYVPGLPLSSILGLMVDWATDDPLSILDPEDVIMYAATCWTRDYFQVKNTANDTWYTAHYVSYAVSSARCVGGYVYNPDTNSYVFAGGIEHSVTTYSTCYDDMERRKSNAVQAFLGGYTNYCCTGDINFYLINDSGVVNFNGDTDPLFTHKETSVDYIPRTDYD